MQIYIVAQLARVGNLRLTAPPGIVLMGMLDCQSAVLTSHPASLSVFIPTASDWDGSGVKVSRSVVEISAYNLNLNIWISQISPSPA